MASVVGVLCVVSLLFLQVAITTTNDNVEASSTIDFFDITPYTTDYTIIDTTESYAGHKMGNRPQRRRGQNHRERTESANNTQLVNTTLNEINLEEGNDTQDYGRRLSPFQVQAPPDTDYIEGRNQGSSRQAPKHQFYDGPDAQNQKGISPSRKAPIHSVYDDQDQHRALPPGAVVNDPRQIPVENVDVGKYRPNAGAPSDGFHSSGNSLNPYEVNDYSDNDYQDYSDYQAPPSGHYSAPQVEGFYQPGRFQNDQWQGDDQNGMRHNLGGHNQPGLSPSPHPQHGSGQVPYFSNPFNDNSPQSSNIFQPTDQNHGNRAYPVGGIVSSNGVGGGVLVSDFTGSGSAVAVANLPPTESPPSLTPYTGRGIQTRPPSPVPTSGTSKYTGRGIQTFNPFSLKPTNNPSRPSSTMNAYTNFGERRKEITEDRRQPSQGLPVHTQPPPTPKQFSTTVMYNPFSTTTPSPVNSGYKRFEIKSALPGPTLETNVVATQVFNPYTSDRRITEFNPYTKFLQQRGALDKSKDEPLDTPDQLKTTTPRFESRLPKIDSFEIPSREPEQALVSKNDIYNTRPTDAFTGFHRFDVRGLDHTPPPRKYSELWGDDRGNNVQDIRVGCDIENNVMLVDMQFDDDFNGIVFCQGYYKSDRCRVRARGGRHHRIAIPMDLCGTEVGNNFQDEVFYNNTIVVMNDAAFGVMETHDRAYTVSCMWTGSHARTVDSGVQVPLEKESSVFVRPGLIEVPNCFLRIVPGTDPFANDARILELGDTATMDVSIRNQQEVFDIFVSRCYGHDGVGQSKLELLDESGCPTSTKFIKPPVYDHTTNPGETHMYSHFKVFKFPDAEDVYLQCQCMVCYDRCRRPFCSEDRPYPGYAPPQPSPGSEFFATFAGKETVKGQVLGRGKREAVNDTETKPDNAEEVIEDQKIFQKFKVKIPGAREDKGIENNPRSLEEVPIQNCVPKDAFIAVLVSVMAILLLSVTIAVCLYIKLSRLNKVNKKIKQKIPELARKEIIRQSRQRFSQAQANPVRSAKERQSGRKSPVVVTSNSHNCQSCPDCRAETGTNFSCECEADCKDCH